MFAGRRTCIIFETGFQKNSLSLMYTLFTVLCGLLVIKEIKKTRISENSNVGNEQLWYYECELPHFECEECVIKLCAIIMWENQESSFLEDLHFAM